MNNLHIKKHIRQKGIFYIIIFLAILAITAGCTQKPAVTNAPPPSPSTVPVEITPDPPEQAQILARQGKFEEAESMLKKALEKEPDNIQLYLVMALILRQKGDLKAAMEICERGLEKKPENLQLLEEKAALLFQTRQHEESAMINIRILELFKTDPSISPDMASLAREQIAKAWKDKPGSPELKKSFDIAMSMLNKELEKKPGDELLQKEKAYMYQNAGKYGEAVAVFRKIDEVEKKNLFVPLDIGKTYLAAGNYKKAEEEFEKTIKQYPDNFRSYRNFGFYWLERGTNTRGDKALEYLDKSVQYYEKALSLVTLPIDTSYLQFKAAEGRYHRWKVTKTDEDKKAAIAAFEKYYKLAPDWTTTDIAEPFMKELKK